MSTAAPAAGRGRRFIVNVLWSWAGVVVNILIAALLSPYVIRKLGESTFSVWTLALSFIEYFWLIDVGLRSATIKFSAEFRATDDERGLTELLNTGLFYSTMCGVAIALLALASGGPVAGFFRIAEPAFPFLLSIVGVSWAFGMSLSILMAVLEGHQRFDVITSIVLTGTIFRSAGTAIAIAAGYGLYQMGSVMLSAQILMAAMGYIAFRRLFPGILVSFRDASWPMLRRMASYGAHSFKVLVATRLLNQSTPFLIAYFLPLPNVAYYAVPVRILEYAAETIGRIGMVTTPNAAELMAQGRRDAIANLGVLANRYSFTLFAPVTIFLLVYAHELYALWIRPEFANNSAYLVPVLLIGYTVVAGQHNSVSILFGIGRHQRYSTCLLIESVLSVAGMAIALPRFGLIGAACVHAVLATLNRGVVACLLLSRELGLSPFRYAAEIYARPLAVTGIAMIVLFNVKRFVPGTTWLSLAEAAASLGVVYLPLAFALCLSAAHRELLAGRIRRALRAA